MQPVGLFQALQMSGDHGQIFEFLARGAVLGQLGRDDGQGFQGGADQPTMLSQDVAAIDDASLSQVESPGHQTEAGAVDGRSEAQALFALFENIGRADPEHCFRQIVGGEALLGFGEGMGGIGTGEFGIAHKTPLRVGGESIKFTSFFNHFFFRQA